MVVYRRTVTPACAFVARCSVRRRACHSRLCLLRDGMAMPIELRPSMARSSAHASSKRVWTLPPASRCPGSCPTCSCTTQRRVSPLPCTVQSDARGLRLGVISTRYCCCARSTVPCSMVTVGLCAGTVGSAGCARHAELVNSASSGYLVCVSARACMRHHRCTVATLRDRARLAHPVCRVPCHVRASCTRACHHA